MIRLTPPGYFPPLMLILREKVNHRSCSSCMRQLWALTFAMRVCILVDNIVNLAVTAGEGARLRLGPGHFYCRAQASKVNGFVWFQQVRQVALVGYHNHLFEAAL